MARDTREATEVRIASAVVTGVTRDGYRLRGKLVVHFVHSQTEAGADECIGVLSQLARQAMNDVVCKGEAPTDVAEFVRRIQASIPDELPRVQRLQLVASQIVGVAAGPTMRFSAAAMPRSVSRSNIPRANEERASSVPPSAPASLSRHPVAATARRSLTGTLAMPSGMFEAPSQGGPMPAPVWIRRRALWAKTLAGLPAAAPPDDLVGPLSVAIRDASARLSCALLLAFDHQDFDLSAAISGKAHVGFTRKLRSETLLCAGWILQQALDDADLPGSLSTPIMDELFHELGRDSIRHELDRYGTGAHPSEVLAETLCAAMPGQRSDVLQGVADGIIPAVRHDMAAAARILARAHARSTQPM